MGEQQTQSQDLLPRIWMDARVIMVEGASAIEFLQGYLTSDTQRLQPNKALPMAVCNIKGRVLANGWALPAEEGVGLLVHHSVVAPLEALLQPFLNFSSAAFADAGAQFVLVERTRGIALLDELHVTPLTALPDGYLDISAELAHTLIEHKLALVSAPVSERFMPQMLGLEEHGAVDFDKGCYLGQEIVARAQHRGAVKRRLQQVTLDDIHVEIGDAWGSDATVVSVAANLALVVAKVAA